MPKAVRPVGIAFPVAPINCRSLRCCRRPISCWQRPRDDVYGVRDFHLALRASCSDGSRGARFQQRCQVSLEGRTRARSLLGTRDRAMLSCGRARGGTHPVESNRLSSGSSQAFSTQACGKGSLLELGRSIRVQFRGAPFSGSTACNLWSRRSAPMHRCRGRTATCVSP